MRKITLYLQPRFRPSALKLQMSLAFSKGVFEAVVLGIFYSCFPQSCVCGFLRLVYPWVNLSSLILLVAYWPHERYSCPFGFVPHGASLCVGVSGCDLVSCSKPAPSRALLQVLSGAASSAGLGLGLYLRNSAVGKIHTANVGSCPW